MKKHPVLIALILAVGVFAASRASFAAGSVIRDAEIEDTLRVFSRPVFEAAGIGAQDINIIILDDEAINAFVAGGLNLFLHTGLILKTENPEELIGVIAHETGHIAGGHLIRTTEVLENASFQTIVATVLGIAAAIGTGTSEVAGAVSAGGQNVAMRNFLTHSRAQEASADQAAAVYLDSADIPAHGLTSFLKKMEGEELLPPSQQSEYIRTHPLTQNRIQYLEDRVEKSAQRNYALPADWEKRHAVMKAKILAFKNPSYALSLYRAEDKAMEAQYARAIAHYRQNNMDLALKMLAPLIAEHPDNAYFYELKGQILFENAKVAEAVPFYKQAVDLAPDSGLLHMAYAHALIETYKDNGDRLQEAVTHLRLALKTERRSAWAHRLLATAYGRLGEKGPTHLHLAEEALLQNNKDTARRQLELAEQHLEKSTPAWLRAQDLKKVLEKDK